MQKNFKILLSITAALIFLLIINYWPTFNLKTKKMKSMETENFVLYFERQDENGAKDMAKILESTYRKINSAMNFSREEKTKIYIYPDLKTFQTKKYGLLGRILGPKWYIGDNIKDKVIIVSPLNPGPVHDYSSVVQAVVHEYVHTVVYQINDKTPKFLDEGLAGYLSGNTKPDYPLDNIPEMKELKISSPVEFGSRGLYGFSYTYIEFLHKKYGFGKIVDLVKNPSAYEEIFGAAEEDLYKQWVQYVKENY